MRKLLKDLPIAHKLVSRNCALFCQSTAKATQAIGRDGAERCESGQPETNTLETTTSKNANRG